jgi:hypothetical protein
LKRGLMKGRIGGGSVGGVLSDVYFTVVMNDNFGRGHACSNWTMCPCRLIGYPVVQ